MTDFNQVRGRVAAAPIPAGAQILGTYLEEDGRMALAYEVPRGRRAVTIGVDQVTGVGRPRASRQLRRHVRHVRVRPADRVIRAGS